MAVQGEPQNNLAGLVEPDRDVRARLETLLSRPIQQRILEFKYRFAQAAIFGMPVLVLQWFGHSLGGSSHESDRWIGLLQAILSGWVTYVGSVGMLIEGLLLLRRNLLADCLVAVVAIAMYLYSVVSVFGVFFKGQPFYQPLLFHWSVILLAAWCGLRWRWMNKTSGTSPHSG